MRAITVLMLLASFVIMICGVSCAEELKATTYGVPAAIGATVILWIGAIITDIHFVNKYEGDPWDLI